jgi:ergothioneine biosynthesis protein EgtB
MPAKTSAAIRKQTAPENLAARFTEVRAATDWIVEPLEPEDCVIQSMPDVSPTRWHLAHTTWFFEAFVLSRADADYEWVNDSFRYFFNSYYNALGRQFPRARRGVLSRPTVAEILAYRSEVDRRVAEALASGGLSAELLQVVEIGLHHEQQHQELMLTDLKHVLAQNPLFPAYGLTPGPEGEAGKLGWRAFEGGVTPIGHDGEGFAYDNEGPRHRVFLEPYELADRLASNGEYLAFLQDGGYERAELWLSAGWATITEQGWSQPLYWFKEGSDWMEFTLGGLQVLNLEAPVCHLSYFEADAFARWSNARLPTEFEWESASACAACAPNFLESRSLHPRPAGSGTGLRQMYGDAWEWTSSSYGPYPGYRAPEGAIGEYNGKFMCGQYVLRGGSCATSETHIRPTYRNFFPPDARWQFAGVRLARS